MVSLLDDATRSKFFTDRAQANIDRNIGSCCSPDDDMQEINENAFTLAFDGAVDAGASHKVAVAIARHLADKMFPY